MYYHYRNTRKQYAKRLRADPTCTFCENIDPKNIMYETDTAIVVANRTPYDLWEHHAVLDHLLVIPKSHVHSLAELSESELLDAMKICAEYEAKGYSVYARASGSPRRSVYHHIRIL